MNKRYAHIPGVKYPPDHRPEWIIDADQPQPPATETSLAKARAKRIKRIAARAAAAVRG